MIEKVKATDAFEALMRNGGGLGESVEVHGFYQAVCRDKDGNELWRDVIENVVTTVGKNEYLNKTLGGSAYTATPRMGLKGTGTAVAADTQASHASWSEVGLANAPAYSGNRPTVTMGAASAGSAVSSGVVFTFTSSGTVAGAFINNGGSATKDDTTGVLFSAGDFTGGAQPVIATNVLTITFTATVT
jgi:hypothetical protein